jgi:hypothetical protein
MQDPRTMRWRRVWTRCRASLVFHGQRGAIKIEYTVDLGVRRESGVEATRSHQIEGENGLR